MLGGNWTQNAKQERYTALTAKTLPSTLQGVGPLPLTEAYREVSPGAHAEVWYKSAQSDDTPAPEDIEELTVGNDPIVMAARAGKGSARTELAVPGHPVQPLAHKSTNGRLQVSVPRLEGYAQVIVRTAAG